MKSARLVAVNCSRMVLQKLMNRSWNSSAVKVSVTRPVLSDCSTFEKPSKTRKQM